jgi:hypothetical protein
LVTFVLLGVAQATAQSLPAEAGLIAALTQARAAGGVVLRMELTQATRLPPGQPTPEPVQMEITGEVAGPDRARFTVVPRPLPAHLAATSAEPPTELLLYDGKLYQRAGDQWQPTDALPGTLGVTGGGLELVEMAHNVRTLPLGNHRSLHAIYAFDLAADDIRRGLLAAANRLDPQTLRQARLTGPHLTGQGELWVGLGGRPARLILHLERTQPDRPGEVVRITSSTTYQRYGATFPATRFDPTASAVDGAPIPGLIRQRDVATLAVVSLALALLAFALLVLRRRGRWLQPVVTSVVVTGLLLPNMAQGAASLGAAPALAQQDATPQGGEVGRLLTETRTLANNFQPGLSKPLFQLAPNEDYDGDGLTNQQEAEIGTNPLVADTDQDGLSDLQEVVGIPCGPGIRVETDPTNPDSNGDGLRDGDEFGHGECTVKSYNGLDGQIPNAWNPDNDGDGVPDGLDLSPFSASPLLADEEPGPDLTFESLDQDPGDAVVPYPFYVELQVRMPAVSLADPGGQAVTANPMQWAYKTLTWPFDLSGPIGASHGWGALLSGLTDKDVYSTGELRLVPYLQATIACQDLPSTTAREQYGVRIIPLDPKLTCPAATALYHMQLPLLPIEQGGMVYALQAKMLHDAGSKVFGKAEALTWRWQDLRLQWMVEGDISLYDEESGTYVADPSGHVGLMVYETPFTLTGLQVTRQGGASVLVAAAKPATIVGPGGQQPVLDRAITLLRGGLEAQFLTGKLDLHTIAQRFDSSTSSGPTGRWGITEEFRVRYNASMDYPHLDAALTALTTLHTRALLSELYGSQSTLAPTLILASEQKTSAVNLDDYNDGAAMNFSEIILNTCLRPLVTSRSLKIQSYRTISLGGQWIWQPRSLDEVLQQLDSTLPIYALPNLAELDPAYAETLAAHNIVKLATTAWSIGQTAVQAIGTTALHDGSRAFSDAEVAAALLDEDGLLPGDYSAAVLTLLDVFDAGGPVAWLETQWNHAVGLVQGLEELVGSFVDFTPELTFPTSASLLAWTQTGINVLNFLALVSGEKLFAQIANVVSTVIEVYQQVRVLIDAIKASIDALAQGLDVAAGRLFQELTRLAPALSLAGLLFNVGMIWLGLAANIENIPPGLEYLAFTHAIIQTVLLVVLFVAASLTVVGGYVAIAIAIIHAIEQWVGHPITPESWLVNLLFSTSITASTGVAHHQLTPPQVEPLEEYGGLLAGRDFRLKMAGEITQVGPAWLLPQAYAQLHLGKGATTNWDKGVLYCPPPLDILQDSYHCWQGDAESLFYVDQGSLQPWTGFPQDPLYAITSQTVAGIDVSAPTPQINGELKLDVLLEVRNAYLLENVFDSAVGVYDLYCGEGGCWPVDGQPQPNAQGVIPSVPWIGPIYFDILPATLHEFWHWDELANADPDGDGLIGRPATLTQPAIPGPDLNLCGNPLSHLIADVDQDGLSDGFEYHTPGLNPCLADSDGDGLKDGDELRLGLDPTLADSDGDGLSDGVEVARWSGNKLYTPWRIKVTPNGLLPLDPAAFPNPRQANADGDQRNDAQERVKGSSPNARNAKTADEFGGGLTISPVSSGNLARVTLLGDLFDDSVAGLAPTLIITLPVATAGVSVQIGLIPATGNALLDQARRLPSSHPQVLRYQLPPLTPGRRVAGLLDAPAARVLADGLAGVQVQLHYTQAGSDRWASAQLTTPHRERLLTTVSRPLENAVTNAPEVLVEGEVRGAPATVFVCITNTTCGDADWRPATGAGRWSYLWTPPGDGRYQIDAYAVTAAGLRSATTSPRTLLVDRTAPASVTFDLQGTVRLSSTLDVRGVPFVRLTGSSTDAAGPAASGIDQVAVLLADGSMRPATVNGRGEQSVRFTIDLPVQPGHTYSLTAVAGDGAGNLRRADQLLRVVADEPPAALTSAAAPPPLENAPAQPNQDTASPTDTTPPLIEPRANLFGWRWQTDLSPTLVISWPTVSDRSGVAGVFAVIDTHPETIPTTPVAGNQISRRLDRPAIYYAHVRAVDHAGNEQTHHLGPYPVNRSTTPSLIAVDGQMATRNGEYPATMLLTDDPQGEGTRAELWGTWDNDFLYLAHAQGSWRGQQFHLYLETRNGGITTAHPTYNHTHSLPFAADYLLVLDGENTRGYTLYQAERGQWVAIDAGRSQVKLGSDTEIALDRDLIAARGAVKLVGYIADAAGLTQVFPATARRPGADWRQISGPVTLGDALHWAALADGVHPSANQPRLLTPLVTLTSGRNGRVGEGEVIHLTAVISNTNRRALENATLVLQTSPHLALTGLSGGDCVDCPAGGSRWQVRLHVAGGASAQLAVQAQSASALPDGVYPISVTVGMAQSRGDVTKLGVAAWLLDAAPGRVQLQRSATTFYAQPGPVEVPFDLGPLASCLTGVEVNTGTGWTAYCAAGCYTYGGNLAANASQPWQFRLRGQQGRTSPLAQVTVVADAVAPTVALSVAASAQRNPHPVQGVAADAFPTSLYPHHVEVSLAGGRFAALPVSPQTGAWRLPWRHRQADGLTLPLTVQAVDQAGNRSAPTASTLTLDFLGPQVTVLPGATLAGTVVDGSGVAAVEVSVDGGITYAPATVDAGRWSWSADGATTQSQAASAEVILVRARDSRGNESYALATWPSAAAQQLYLPVIVHDRAELLEYVRTTTSSALTVVPRNLIFLTVIHSQ